MSKTAHSGIVVDGLDPIGAHIAKTLVGVSSVNPNAVMTDDKTIEGIENPAAKTDLVAGGNPENSVTSVLNGSASILTTDNDVLLATDSDVNNLSGVIGVNHNAIPIEGIIG